MRVDPQYFSLPRPVLVPERQASCRGPAALRDWPAHIAPSMAMLHDLALNLSRGRASVSLERPSDDPVLRISRADRCDVETLRRALVLSLTGTGFREIEPGLLQRPGPSGSLVGVGPVTADPGTAVPAFELWALDGVPAEAAQTTEPEAAP